MIDERFVIVGVIINFFGGLSYLIDTIKGKVKPNKVSWLLWAIAPLIAFTAEIKQGVGLTSLMTFTVGFIPLCVFIASFFNKKSEWKLKKFDLFCGLLSLVGLLLWWITKVDNVAIIFSILADGTAAMPTVIKSYLEPESEDYKVYLASVISAGLTLLTIKEWKFAHYSFPIYIFTICLFLTILIKFQAGKLISSKLGLSKVRPKDS